MNIHAQHYGMAGTVFHQQKPALYQKFHVLPKRSYLTRPIYVHVNLRYIFQYTHNSPSVFTEKECLSNGEWNQTSDTTTCIITRIQRQRHNFHIIVLSVSTVIALPAIIIFFAFSKLRILRVILHRNLLLAVVCRNIFSIVVKTTLILDQLDSEEDSVMQKNTVGCRVLVFFENVAKNAIFTAMVVDGFYLHKLIVRVFAKDPKEYVLHGITIGECKN